MPGPGLALAIRLLSLGSPALNDSEASWALQALDVARRAGALASQPAYVFLTGLTFSLSGSSNFAARLWPSLLGASLALWPVFFRRLLGRNAALILAFELALDPGLVALSRQAGSPLLAVSFGLWALALAYAGWAVPAGIVAGLALLSGPAILPGLLAFGLAWAVFGLVEPAHLALLREPQDEPDLSVSRPSRRGRSALFALGLTVLVGGSLFFLFPQGLGVWAASLPDWIAGWSTPSGVPALRLAAGLLVYNPLAVLFGAIGALQSWIGRSREDLDGRWRLAGRFLTLWLAFSLALALLYPGRTMGDLAWALVPLLGLAALGLWNLLAGWSEFPLASLGQATLVFILLALVWLNLAGLTYAERGVPAYTLRLGLLGGVLLLGGLTTALVSLGWNWDVARRGLLWGVLAALGLYVVANTGRAALFHPVDRPDIQELWAPAPAIEDADLLLKTLGDLSDWHTGRRDMIDVTVEVDSQALPWLLRDMPNTQFVHANGSPVGGASLNVGGQPAVVITHQAEEVPSLAAAYRGQDFNWWVRAGLERRVASGFHPLAGVPPGACEGGGLILWGRGDLFPGGVQASGDQTSCSG
jgi:hypothetical protein